MPADDRVAAALEEIRQRHALVTGPENGNWGRLDELHAAAFRLSHEDAGVLLAALDAVLALHREFRIYEECEHRHACDSDEDRGRDGVVVCSVAGFVTCEDGYLYSVCKECCAGGVDQTEECAADHHHSACWPCPTYEAITRALLGEENSDA